MIIIHHYTKYTDYSSMNYIYYSNNDDTKSVT